MKRFMMRLYVPIRFKILVTLLFVVTTAVGGITFTMAKLFEVDKTAYINDLTPITALQTAEEARHLLVGYRDKLMVFARLMEDPDLSPAKKGEMLKELFEDFHEFIVVGLHDGRGEMGMIFDAQVLKESGLSGEQIRKYYLENPLPTARVLGKSAYVKNCLLSSKLPALTIAIAKPGQDGPEAKVMFAMVRLEALLKLAGRSRVFETFIFDQEGIPLVHSNAELMTSKSILHDLPQLRELQNSRSLVTTAEYVRNGEERLAGDGGDTGHGEGG